MSTETHTIPDDTAAHYERLITEAEKMRQAGADALKAAYADLRADLKQLGWAGASISAEVAAFKGAIAEMALAEADKAKRDEKGERVDDYVSLLTRARARGQRKIDERFDPITGEFVDDNEASDGSPSVSSSLATREAEESVVSNSPVAARNEPEAAAEVAGNDLREPVAAEQGQIIREGDAPRETDRLGGDASCLDTEFQMDRATEGSFETGSEAAEKGREAIPAGPEGVDLNHAGSGESPETDFVLEYVPASGVKRLPFAHCFPELSKAEYDRLEKDIAANRVKTPITRQGDVIVDGWARYTISRTYGLSYPVQEYTGTDVLLDVIEWQRASRKFTPAQEKKIADDLAKEIPHRADDIFAAFGLAEALEAAQ